MDFDKVLDKVGGYRRFQKFYVLILGLAAIPMGAMTLANMFISGLPQFSCDVPQLANLSRDQRVRLSAPMKAGDAGADNYDLCHVYDINYDDNVWTQNNTINNGENVTNSDKEGGNQTLRKCDAWVYERDVYEYTIVTRWDLVCNNNWKKSLSQSLFMLGFLFGALTFGSLADRFGRRPAFFIALTIFVITGNASAYMPTYWSFVFVRLLTGASGAGFFTIAFVIQMEVIGVQSRMIPGILYQGWFCAGYMILALFAYGIRNYQHLQTLLSTLPILLFSYIWFLGESPRWLMSQGRMEECSREVKRMAKMNQVDYPQDLMEQQSKMVLTQTSVQDDKKYTVLDLLRTPNMRKKSLNLFYNWFVNSFVYYGLTLAMADLAGGPYLNLFLSGVMEFAGFIPAIVLLDRIGRRLPLSLLLIGAGSVCLIITTIPQEYAISTTVLAMFGKLCISGSFAIIYVFSAEQFPTVSRTMGVGAGSMSARAGGLLAPFLADLIHIWRPLPFFIFGCATILAGVLTMFLPETLNRHLPETLEDGEAFKMDKFEWYCKSAPHSPGPDVNGGPIIQEGKTQV